MAAAALLLIGAAFLRLYQIDRRPFHADEAVQAYQTWQLLRGEGYTYDPADKHGPFLYYAAAGITKISGWSPDTLNETRFRSVTLIAGLGTIGLILGAASRFGRGAVLVGAALLATAPLAVIYDTYFVQEAWFCFFTWALFFAVMRWWDGTNDKADEPNEISQGIGRDRWARRSDDRGRPGGPTIPTKPALAGAVLVGALAGLMQASKETSVLHFAALGAALIASRTCSAFFGGTRPPGGFSPARVPETRPEAGLHLGSFLRLWPNLLAALFTAVFVYVLFYSSFFTHWAGVFDGLRAYFHYAARAAGSAHDQPWSYYFSMLWPHSSGGVRWGEPLLLFAALAGVVFAFTPGANSTQRALALFTLILLLLYSLIPYKTPWLLLTPYVGLTLLAGLGAAQSAAGLPANLARFAPVLLGLIILGAGIGRNFPALDRYASDDRNPYIYQPTSSDLARLTATINAMPADRKIAVISPDHAWPLPWYLRDRAAIGYFTAPPANLDAYDLVLFDSRLDSLLPQSVSAFGLRPNVVLWSTTR